LRERMVTELETIKKEKKEVKTNLEYLKKLFIMPDSPAFLMRKGAFTAVFLFLNSV
jgi:hypothetical protein